MENFSHLQLTILVICLLAILSKLKPRLSHAGLPFAGSQWPILRALQSLTKGKELLQSVYEKQRGNDRPYILSGVLGDSVILPPTMLPWLIAQPESSCSAKWAQMDTLSIPTTFLRPEIGLNPIHEPLVRRNLTAHLDNITGDLWQEAGHALEQLWGSNSREWREINLDYTIRRVVARTSNRVFVGEELCRNDDFLESSISYVTRVSTVGFLLNLLPRWLRKAAGIVLTVPIRSAWSGCARHLVPMFSRAMELKETGDSQPMSGLFCSLLVDNTDKFPATSLECTPDFLGRRIMALNFASIHTSTLTVCSMILDVFSSSPETVSLLRDEAIATNDSWATTWNRSRLNGMARLDSSLRESMRLWGIIPKGLLRKVVAPDGVTLPGGQRVPVGSAVCVSGWGLNHDETMYPRPTEFVHDRFLKKSDSDKAAVLTNSGKMAKGQILECQGAAVEITDRLAGWGWGKHACPGRFFAVDLVKVILIQILMKYDIQLLAKRPDNMWVEYNSIPPPTATLRIRRRE